jgi:putative restriction endonuclease
MPRRDWTREDLIVAFNLYCKIPFGQIHIRNPQVIELAKAIGRKDHSRSHLLDYPVIFSCRFLSFL